MNKIQEVINNWGSVIPKETIEAVIDEIDNHMHKSMKSRNIALREQAMHFNWYDTALLEIKQLLEDSIK